MKKTNEPIPPKNELILYQTEDGKIRIEVRLQDETVWLTQKQMAALLDKDSDTIGLHIRNIYKERELMPEGTTEDSSVVQAEGGRQVRRKVSYYNHDDVDEFSVNCRFRSRSCPGTCRICLRGWPHIPRR